MLSKATFRYLLLWAFVLTCSLAFTQDLKRSADHTDAFRDVSHLGEESLNGFPFPYGDNYDDPDILESDPSHYDFSDHLQDKSQIDKFGFSGGIGKRRIDKLGFSGGIGKRRIDKFGFSGGIGKRRIDKFGFSGGIGKRRIDKFGFSGGIGKRRIDKFGFSGGIGKRRIDKFGFSGGIGKRRIDKFGFSGGIGKRTEAERLLYEDLDGGEAYQGGLVEKEKIVEKR